MQGVIIFLHKIKLFYKECIWWVQRRFKGYATYDLWDLDYFLGKFIIKILKDFKKRNNGIPVGFTEKEWDVELEDMVEGFEFFVRINDIDFNYTEEEYKEAKNKANKFIEHFNRLWY
jgi:hypothetical protein